MLERSEIDDAALHLARIWRDLADGLRAPHSPWRTPSVATAGLDGSPRSRTVVLRSVDASTCALAFHADARSDKVAELRRDPRVACLFWDPQAQTQLRVQGVARLHVGDALTDSLWGRVPAGSRPNYASGVAPGTVVEDPLALCEGASDGRENFAVVVTRAGRFDWLWLRREGHVRCVFDLDLDLAAAPRRTWVAP